jgi:hypothetical protein
MLLHFVQIEHIVVCVVPIRQNCLHHIHYKGLLRGTLNPKVDLHTNQRV